MQPLVNSEVKRLYLVYLSVRVKFLYQEEDSATVTIILNRSIFAIGVWPPSPAINLV